MRTRTLVIGTVLGCGGLTVIGIVACAGFFYFIYDTFKDTGTAVSSKIDALFAAIDKGTFADAYETETTPEFRETLTKKEWQELGSAIKMHLGHFKSKQLVNSWASGFKSDQSANVEYSATFDKGSADIRAHLKLIGGNWRFMSFRVESPAFIKDLATRPCPHCGAACPRSAKFCPSCGKSVVDHDKTEPVSKEKNEGQGR